jgi:hypothetical protein
MLVLANKQCHKYCTCYASQHYALRLYATNNLAYILRLSYLENMYGNRKSNAHYALRYLTLYVTILFATPTVLRFLVTIENLCFTDVWLGWLESVLAGAYFRVMQCRLYDTSKDGTVPYNTLCEIVRTVRYHTSKLLKLICITRCVMTKRYS